MRISTLKKAAKTVLSRQEIKKPVIPKILDDDGQIDYQLIQKDVLSHHYAALANCAVMQARCFEVGDIEGAAKIAVSMKLHTDIIARFTGINYYSNINTAIKRLEAEGFVVSMPEQVE